MRWLMVVTALSLVAGVFSFQNLYEATWMARINASGGGVNSAPYPSDFQQSQKSSLPSSTLPAGVKDVIAAEQFYSQVDVSAPSSIGFEESDPEVNANPKIPVEELYTATRERRVGERIPVTRMFTGQIERRVGERIPVEQLYTNREIISVGEPIPVDLIISNPRELRIGDRITPPDDEHLIIATP